MALTRQDWIDAAKTAFEEGGPDKISISELARTLKASRGSFYWHFSDHSDLLEAVLEAWEWELTDAQLAETAHEVDPRARLTRMLEAGFTNPEVPTVDVVMAMHADHATIGPVVRRITQKRISALAAVLRELGFEDSAEDRALVAYSSFLGWLHLRHIDPDLGGDRSAVIARMVDAMVAGFDDSASSRASGRATSEPSTEARTLQS